MTTDSEPRSGPAAPAPPRRRGWRIAGALLAGLLLLVGGFVLRLLWIGGAFVTIEPHFAGRCRLVDGPVGPEDLTINQRTGRAYLAATDRRAREAGQPEPGGIWAYDVGRPGAVPVNLTPDADLYLQPIGLSLWIEPDGSETLFLVNRPVPGHGWPRNTIEVYDVDQGALVHRATLTDPRLVTSNDLAAVGVDRFYVTNTHVHPSGWWQTLETYLQWRGARVLGYGPGGFYPAISGLVFPNGINVSSDGRTVYVASTTGRSVLIYDRNPETDALTARDEIAVGSGVDNIEIDPDGALWIGSHPKLLEVPKHAADASVPAPAQVLRVSPDGSEVKEVYLDDGDEIAAASAAARYGTHLLIGQVFGQGFLDCEMEGR